MFADSNAKRMCMQLRNSDLYFHLNEFSTSFEIYRWQMNCKQWDSYMNEPMKDNTIVDNQYVVNINGVVNMVYFPQLTYRQYIRNMSNPFLIPMKEFIKRQQKFIFQI